MALRSRLQKIGLWPRYTEAALFGMGLSFGLLFATNSEFRDAINEALAGAPDWRAFGLIIFFTAGLALALFHAFSRRSKTALEKNLLLFFTVIINVLVGLIAGAYVLRSAPGWAAIFPLWNILSALGLAAMPRTSLVNEPEIAQENAKMFEIIATSAVTLVLFTASQYVFLAPWAITLSLGIGFGIMGTSLLKRGLNQASQKNYAPDA